MLEKLTDSKWAKRFISLAGGLFIGASVLFNPISASAEEAVLMVLCHGIKSNPQSMKKIENAVKDNSEVVNVYYPSTEQRIKNFSYNLDVAIKDKLVQLKQQNKDVVAIVLVGHSMGGLVERYYIECGNASFADVVSKVKVIVMIATPNHGSPLADIVCYHAIINGIKSDAIPASIREAAKPTGSKEFKPLPLDYFSRFFKNLFNKTSEITTIINFADSTWGKTSVYDLNTAPDGFIEGELNKLGLRQDIPYVVVAGTDGSLLTDSFMVDDPLYKYGSDGVVPVKRADISDLLKGKSNYAIETMNANHLNITENEELIAAMQRLAEATKDEFIKSKSNR